MRDMKWKAWPRFEGSCRSDERILSCHFIKQPNFSFCALNLSAHHGLMLCNGVMVSWSVGGWWVIGHVFLRNTQGQEGAEKRQWNENTCLKSLSKCQRKFNQFQKWIKSHFLWPASQPIFFVCKARVCEIWFQFIALIAYCFQRLHKALWYSFQAACTT